MHGELFDHKNCLEDVDIFYTFQLMHLSEACQALKWLVYATKFRKYGFMTKIEYPRVQVKIKWVFYYNIGTNNTGKEI